MTPDKAAIIRAGRAVGAQALVLVGLGTCIATIYVGVVVGVGRLTGGPGLALSVLATGIVAVAFEPARGSLRRWSNRLMYGRRSTPYEVLSQITRRLKTAVNEEDLLVRMAAMLGAGTGAARAAVWLADGAGFATAATKPTHDRLVAANPAELPGAVHLIKHDGEVLGALTVEKGGGAPLTAIEQRLMADLAGAASLVLRKLRLDAELEAKARELQLSRRRLIEAQDVERRRLERDLRDGVERLVGAMAGRLMEARMSAAAEGVGRAVTLVDQIIDEAHLAAEQIRSLARGIYPSALVTGGLAPAVRALAAHLSLDVSVEADVLHRHPLQHESAVYFCLSEALTNAFKHGRGPVRVRVADGAGRLTFEVTDSGPGFHPVATSRGAGLANMADRLDTLGGSLLITSTPGSCTTVSGRLPVPEVDDVLISVRPPMPPKAALDRTPPSR